jgi:hypothetical protein
VTLPERLVSKFSNRLVVTGWKNIAPGAQDIIELQLDLDPKDAERSQALLLIEYWTKAGELGIQSLLPVRAFSEPNGWCMMLPAEGRVYVRAIDPEPTPPVLAVHGIILDPATVPGTVVNVKVDFPDVPAPAPANLGLQS